jgi:thioredoxin reductase/Pyruvate/2-oxoacid:ferredoxin oxidoreductase delta subunit
VVELSSFDIAVVLAAVTAVLLGIAGWIALRGRRTRLDSGRLQLSVEEKSNIPPSLHPIIDPAICIGSLSCVRGCPEGDILGLIDGKAKLVEASHCIGHSKCALECPVDAIKLVFGSKEKGVDLPETDEHFESARPGVFIIGELGGMGLIKNAIRQGLDVSRHVKAGGASGGSAKDEVDVAIVGAGPAGIACAVGCREQGLSFRLLEQDTLGGTVAHYPRGKVVMSEQVTVPFYGRFGATLISKEDLLVQLTKMLDAADARVEEGTKVEGIDGDKGAFTVSTSRGPVRARNIVLATGLRGSPRKLGVDGEDSSRIAYRLVDPAQYDGDRVLVVGGGDSAVEAAIQLANETRARVTISYRKDSFARAKPRNRELIADLVSRNRVRAVMSSQVTRVGDGQVELKTAEGEVGQLKNDKVLVCIGGELPTKFLQKAGVSVRRFHGEQQAQVARGSTANRRLAAARSSSVG